MSKLEVKEIGPISGETDLKLGQSGGTVTLADGATAVGFGTTIVRNLIINGAMQVAQRGTQVTGVTSDGYHTCDRMNIQVSSLGTWTVDQSTDAPNGFSNSFKATCTTANASPAASNFCLLRHRIVAKNLQHLAFGTADAKSMTLSFWVKSNKTGAASFDILQGDNSNKHISKSYNINSANTWEYKTISIPADTSGVINNDNGSGFQIGWWLNSGTDFSSGSLQPTWSTYDSTNRNPSNLGVGGAVNDYFAVTGVQLEVGSVATPFEHESFGQTLAKCQRYYTKSYDYEDSPGTSTVIGAVFFRGAAADSVTNRTVNVSFPVDMRANPTSTLYSTSGTSGAISDCGTGFSELSVITGSNINGTTGTRGFSKINSGTSVNSVIALHFVADAEL